MVVVISSTAHSSMISARATDPMDSTRRNVKNVSSTLRWSLTASTPGAPSSAEMISPTRLGSDSFTRNDSGIEAGLTVVSSGLLRNCSLNRAYACADVSWLTCSTRGLRLSRSWRIWLRCVGVTAPSAHEGVLPDCGVHRNTETWTLSYQ